MLQVNLNRCHAAHDLLEIARVERKINIVLASEPNGSRVAGSWLRDTDDGDVAIWIGEKVSRRIKTAGSPGKGIVWVDLGGVVMVACYASPNKSMEEFGV